MFPFVTFISQMMKLKYKFFNMLITGFSSVSDCPKAIAFLPSQIPDPMSCHIPDYCTGIECCADIPVLGLGLHVTVFLDLDKLELQIGLETVKETIKLNDYVWGDVKTISVAAGLFKLRYVNEF